MISRGRIRGCCPFADQARVRAVLHVKLPIGSNWTEVQVSQMAPALQHDPALELLAFGSYDDAIVLAPRAPIMVAPVQLQAGKLQFIKSDEQIFRPLVTVATFPEAVIDQEIVEDRRTKHAVLSPKLANSCVTALCQQLRFLSIHSR